MTRHVPTTGDIPKLTRAASRVACAITWVSQVWSAAMYLAAVNHPAMRGELFAEDPVFAVCLWVSLASLVLIWAVSLRGEQKSSHAASRRSHRRTGLACQTVLLLVSLAVTFGRPGWTAWGFDLLLLFSLTITTWAGWMRSASPALESRAPEDAAAVRWQIPSGKHDSLVYFIRNGNRMKIGITTELKRRIRTLALRSENIALLLSGDRRFERQLHGQFSDLRVGNTEWFAYEGALAKYVTDQIARITRKDQGK